jgi:hypothetical protein
MLSALVAETVVFAQAPGVPTLVRPSSNSTSPGFDVSGLGMFVQLMPVANVAKYRICVRDVGAPTCYINLDVPANGGFPMNDGSRKFNLSTGIPANRQSTVSEWSARACTSNNQCGAQAPFQRFFVVPNAPTLTGPAANATLTNTRRVTYTWTANQAANAGYQLYILTRAPEEIGFNLYRPEATLPMPSEAVFIPPGTTSRTLDLAPGQTIIGWSVASCANFQERGRRCSVTISPFRTLTAPAFFGFVMAPTFRHQRCANCHAVVPDNFQNDVATNQNRGLPSNHQAVNANTNCTSCHTNGLLPSEGTINPGWHAEANMDFRNRTDQQLCAFARTGAGGATSANAVRDHLTQDKLILWAVGDGRVPQGRPRLQTAPPDRTPPDTAQEIQAWQQLVNRWVDYGMPCN